MSTTSKFTFVNYISTVVELSDQAIEHINSNLTVFHCKKGDVIVRQGEISKGFFFIRKGLLRSYMTYDENQITSWVGLEGSMAASITGFFSQTPSMESIDCLEDSELEYFEFEDLHVALKLFPELTIAYKRMLEIYYAACERRAIIGRIPNAMERFKAFRTYTPESIINRTQKRYIASILNIRPESLSRLIKKYKSES